MPFAEPPPPPSSIINQSPPLSLAPCPSLFPLLQLPLPLPHPPPPTWTRQQSGRSGAPPEARSPGNTAWGRSLENMAWGRSLVRSPEKENTSLGPRGRPLLLSMTRRPFDERSSLPGQYLPSQDTARTKSDRHATLMPHQRQAIHAVRHAIHAVRHAIHAVRQAIHAVRHAIPHQPASTRFDASHLGCKV